MSRFSAKLWPTQLKRLKIRSSLEPLRSKCPLNWQFCRVMDRIAGEYAHIKLEKSLFKDPETIREFVEDMTSNSKTVNKVCTNMGIWKMEKFSQRRFVR